jgi:hypothetical protein
MKRAVRFIVILALLMVGTLGAWAQHVESGTAMKGNGLVKLNFSFSGGEIKKKEVRDNKYCYECDVYEGAEITISANLAAAPKGIEEVRLFHKFLHTYDTENIIKEAKGSIKYQYRVTSSDSGGLETDVTVMGTNTLYYLHIKWNVIKKPNTPTSPTTTTPPTRWEPPSYSNCDHPDSHCRFEELWGEVSFRCNDQYDDSYETAEYQTVIKQEDRIQTKEESGAKVWVPDWDTYVNLKEETTVVIRVEEQRIPTVIEMVAGSIWGNIKKMAEGKSIECEMSHCIMGSGEFDLTEEQWRIAKKYRIHPSQFGSIDHQLMDEPHAIPASYVLDPYNSPTFNNIGYTADDDDIVFACEIKNGAGTAYVFKGEMTLRNKDDKTYKLKAGQAGTLARDGKITVKKFDANKIAKKFGITDAQLQGETATTATTTRRYELERAVVKYRVTRGSQQGIMGKCFDNYGSMERRELRMGDQTSIALTQGGNSYTLNKKTKTAKRTQNADLNFLDMNNALMKKLNLVKKGTTTVVGKKCDHYVGRNVEYYVWKGLVMKKVQKNSDGTTTTHEVTSIEEPTSIDPKMFKMPDGYTVK